MRDEVIRRTKSSRKKVVFNIAAKATKNIAMNQSTHRNVLFESSHCFLCDSEGTVERFYADFLVISGVKMSYFVQTTVLINPRSDTSS